MVNELQGTPFYKPHILAMLNTLFPPSVKELPNDRISPMVLHRYRANFYRYALAVEANGPSALKPFIDRHLRPGSKRSWPETRRNLEIYLEQAVVMIDQATLVYGIEFFRDRSSVSSQAHISLSERRQPAAAQTQLVHLYRGRLA